MTVTSMPPPAQDGVVPEITTGVRMRIAMEHAGLGTQDVAEAFEVEKGTVSRWLHDSQPVKRAYVIALAKLTGVDSGWLLTGVPGSFPQPRRGVRSSATRPLRSAEASRPPVTPRPPSRPPSPPRPPSKPGGGRSRRVPAEACFHLVTAA